MSVFRFPCPHGINITQATTFCYLNPPSKASGIAVALFQLILTGRKDNHCILFRLLAYRFTS